MSDAALPAEPGSDGHFAWCSAQCRTGTGSGRAVHRSDVRTVGLSAGEALCGWLVQFADGVPRVAVAVNGAAAGLVVLASLVEVRDFARLLEVLADAGVGKPRNGGRF